MLFVAKCYWPGVTASEFERVAATDLAATARSGGAAYLGSILLPVDGLVLCLLETSSRAAAQAVTDRASVPCERIIDGVWLDPPAAQATGWKRLGSLAGLRRRRPARETAGTAATDAGTLGAERRGR